MFNRSFFSNLPPVTKNILIINIIIWVFLAVTPESTQLRMLNLGGLHYITSHLFGIWQVFTYMFIQEYFWHLFLNMWILLMFGNLIEQRLGSKRFLVYYISCGVGAAIIQLIVNAIMINHYTQMISPQEYALFVSNEWIELVKDYYTSLPVLGQLNGLINGYTIGASGAIFGILLAMGMLFPNVTLYLMFVPYPIKAKWVVLGFGLIEVLLGFSATGDGIAHFAHLGGMLFGFIMIWYWKKQALKNGHWF